MRNIILIVLMFSTFVSNGQLSYWLYLENSPKYDIRDITFDKNGKIFTAGGDGSFISTDNGLSWQTLGLEGDHYFKLIIDDKNFIYIASDHLLRSKDSGKSWEDITSRVGWTVDNRAMIINKRGHLFIGEYRTTDNGDTWTNEYKFMGGYFSYAMNSEGHIFRGGFGSHETICRSTDDGDTWEVVYEDPKEWPNGAVCETVYNMIFSKTDPIGYACSYKTMNNGRSWYIMKDLNSEPAGTAIMMDSMKHIYSFRSAYSLPVYYEGLYKRVVDSTWEKVDTSGLSGEKYFNTMATSPNGYIYLAAHNGGLYRSRDRYVSVPGALEPSGSRDRLSASPNPFSDETSITFSLDVGGEVTISLYDMLGRQIADIFQGYRDEGRHSVQLLITNYELPINPGVYFIRMESQKEVLVSKILILR